MCPQHPEERAVIFCIQKDCPENIIPKGAICNHLAHPNKFIRIFCEDIEETIRNSTEH
jgi:hypothetical protein